MIKSSTIQLNVSKILAASSIIALAACGGGGGGSSGGGSPSNGVTASGVFIDAEVAGLTVQSGSSAPHMTDANGFFTYTVGQPITFSVGGVALGTLADGAARITPNDFMVPLNIARFLQTLDADGNPGNGIDLTLAAMALANTTVSSVVFENGDATAFAGNIAAAVSTAAVATAATGGIATLIDEATAMMNLMNGTNTVFTNAEIAGMAFVIVEPGDPEIELARFNADGSLNSVLSDDTTSAGGNGSISNEIWSIDGNGVLTVSDPAVIPPEPSVITKTGQSTRAISASVVDSFADTGDLLTLMITIPIVAMDLAGNTYTFSNTGSGEGLSETSDLTFNAVDGSSTVSVVDFDANGMVIGGDDGLWSINAFGLLEIVFTSSPLTATVALVDGSFASGELLVLDSMISSGTSANPGSVEGLELLHEGLRFVGTSLTP